MCTIPTLPLKMRSWIVLNAVCVKSYGPRPFLWSKSRGIYDSISETKYAFKYRVFHIHPDSLNFKFWKYSYILKLLLTSLRLEVSINAKYFPVISKLTSLQGLATSGCNHTFKTWNLSCQDQYEGPCTLIKV